MAKRPLPSPEDLRQLLNYHPGTGRLVWKERGPEWFSSERIMNSWNATYAHKEALYSINEFGYRVGTILNRVVRAHRVIWAMQTGQWPVGDIDHIDGDRVNNAWSNLRAVSRRENLRNAGLRSDNKSGHVGVSWNKQVGKWTARISTSEGIYKHLGLFERLEDAADARRKAEVKHGYHRNHGKRPGWDGSESTQTGAT